MKVEPTASRPSQQRVREVFIYDENSGVLRWRISLGQRARSGAIAGNADVHGYHRVRLDGRLYYLHHLIWLYVYGEWPIRKVDHASGDVENNRLTNLRLADDSENAANKAKQSNNSTGYVGVSRCRGKFRAYITFRRKTRHLGVFDTAEEAHACYLIEASKLHGNFARVTGIQACHA